MHVNVDVKSKKGTNARDKKHHEHPKIVIRFRYEPVRLTAYYPLRIYYPKHPLSHPVSRPGYSE